MRAAAAPFRMVQLWVNLPARDKMAPPGYQGIAAAHIPTLPLIDVNGQNAGTVRPIAGTFDGDTGPAKTFTTHAGLGRAAESRPHRHPCPRPRATPRCRWSTRAG